MSQRGPISESELVIPALQLAASKPNGKIATTELISELTDQFRPEGKDAEIALNRTDTYFSQKVRNLVSHRESETSMFSQGWAEYTGDGIRITDAGRQYLNNQPPSLL